MFLSLSSPTDHSEFTYTLNIVLINFVVPIINIMSKKRRFSDFNSGLPVFRQDLAMRKKRKLSNQETLIINSANDPWLNNAYFTNTEDKQQYQQLFVSIDKSQIISNVNVPKDVVKNIAEFSVGEWLKCPNKQCNNNISFLSKDSLDLQGVQCLYCEKKAYYQWCSIHNQSFTIDDLYTSGTFCVGCWKTACHKSMVDCTECCSWRCIKCMGENNICLDCKNVENGFFFESDGSF